MHCPVSQSNDDYVDDDGATMQQRLSLRRLQTTFELAKPDWNSRGAAGEAPLEKDCLFLELGHTFSRRAVERW